jgi:hypothetical protein
VARQVQVTRSNSRYAFAAHSVGKFLTTLEGLDLTPKSDHFSLGCLMAELLANESLFCDCINSYSYVRDKLWMMESLLGRFPEDVIYSIRAAIPKVFKETGKIDLDDPIEVSVEDWVEDHDILDVRGHPLQKAFH